MCAFVHVLYNHYKSTCPLSWQGSHWPARSHGGGLSAIHMAEVPRKPEPYDRVFCDFSEVKQELLSRCSLAYFCST